MAQDDDIFDEIDNTVAKTDNAQDVLNGVKWDMMLPQQLDLANYAVMTAIEIDDNVVIDEV